MTAAELLAALDELLADETRWTAGVYARDAAGKPCWVLSRDAVCWCLHGAFMRVAYGESGEARAQAFCALLEAARQQRSDNYGLYYVNDVGGYQDVRQLIADACQLLETAA